MMIIQFNSLGVITSVDTSNASFRQGSKGEVIQAVFAGKSNSTHTAKINFTRPDGTVVQNLVMLPDPSDQSAFLFELDDLWFLAISGNATMTIFLYNASNVIQAQGQATIPIESSDYIDEDDVPITTEQYDSLLALMSSKVNNSSAVIVVDDIDDLDMDQFGVNQLFYVVSLNQFMQLVENELEEKELKVYDLVPGQQATMSIIANALTNVNGRVLSAYESQIVIVNDFQCYKITRGGENLTEEYASRYMEFMTGSKYLPKYDYYHPQNTYFITPSGLILKPQYDSTNGLLLYPMSNLATRDYVDNDILEITDTTTPLTYEQRQKILTNNVRIKYGNLYYEKVSHLGHTVRFECADVSFKTNTDGSTTISKHFIVIRDDTGLIITADTRELDTYSKTQANQIFANNVEMSVDSNYVLKVKLIDKSGNELAEDSVDLPLESIVQSAQYYETYTYQGTTYEDVIVITLATTDVPTIIPVGDLVSGLVSETTFNNGMATKVDKTNVANKIYGTNGSGSQTTFNIDNNVSGNVVRRDSNSQINVPLIPTNSAHASSKDYVDTFAKDVALSLDQGTYVLTVTLKNANGGNIVSRTVDLPLETMVVSGSYDEINKAIVLVLKNGQTISIPVGDLISGLVSTDYLQANYYNKTQIDQMVSGFVFADVDDHLSSVSTNPVENRVITQALEEKANVDGNYPTMSVGLAENLNTKIVQNEKEAHLFRTTGGSLEVGNNCKEKGIVGGSLGFNQLVQNGNFTSDSNWTKYLCTMTTSNNIATVTVSTQNGSIFQDVSIVNGHKYLATVDIKSSTATDKIKINFQAVGTGVSYLVGIISPNTNKQTLSAIFAYTYNATGRLNIYDNRESEFDSFQVSNAMVIDLTAMFGSTIADYIYSLEQTTAGAGVAWFRRYFNKPYYPHTAIGGFTHVKTSGKKVVGFNQLDLANYYARTARVSSFNTTKADLTLTTDGQGVDCYVGVVTDDVLKPDLEFPIEVVGGQTYTLAVTTPSNTTNVAGFSAVFGYYDANGNIINYDYKSLQKVGNVRKIATSTAPQNAKYVLIRFGVVLESAAVATFTYKDINFNFHYDGERDGEYEPYESETYSNDDIELIGIPHIDAQGNLYYEGDVYRPDGTVERKLGIVDLGSLTWAKEEVNQGYRFRTAQWAKLPNAITSGHTEEVACPKYIYNKASVGQNNINGVFCVYDGIPFVRDDSYTDTATFKTAMSGVYLIYELETPTTDSATPYPETQQVDNWGTEERIDNREVPIPVGHETEYLTDLKSKLEILPNLQHNDGTYIVNVASGVGEYAPIGAWLSANGYIKLTDISGYDSEKTQTLKNINGALTWVTEGE